MGRITLETPAGRRIDLTPVSRRERALRTLGLTAAVIGSLSLWALIFAPIIILLWR